MGLKKVDELEIEAFGLGAMLKTSHTLQAHFAIRNCSRDLFSYNMMKGYYT